MATEPGDNAPPRIGFPFRDDLKEIVREAMREELLTIGLNSEDAESVLEAQADLRYLRSLRKTSEAVKRQSFIVMAGLFVTGIVSVIVLGLKSYFQH